LIFFYSIGFQPEKWFRPGLLSFFRPARVICHRPTPLLLSWAASRSTGPATGLPPHRALASGRPSRLHPLLSLPCGPCAAFFLLEKPTVQPPVPPRARARTVPASPPLPETASHPPLHSPLAPSFPLPKTKGVKAINGALHRRPIPLPVWPPRSPLRPYKMVRSSPLLTHSSSPPFPTLRAPSRPSPSFTAIIHPSPPPASPHRRFGHRSPR
jgi:hypothetical protein